jgi:serine/threonine protein kinase
MARTYFRQLVDAVEYMHNNNFGHLDLKVDNLFLDKEFRLRVGDFDFCSQGDSEVHRSGTPDYRAPEVIKGNGIYERAPADVFSMGICLFVFHNHLITPYTESCEDSGYGPLYALYILFINGKMDLFWKKWEQLMEENIWSREFRELFEGMTNVDVKKRWTIQDVKKSLWYKDEIYSQKELSELMKFSLGH